MSEGDHRRLFWRVKHRLPGWDRMTTKQLRAYLRSVSWRRVL